MEVLSSVVILVGDRFGFFGGLFIPAPSTICGRVNDGDDDGASHGTSIRICLPVSRRVNEALTLATLAAVLWQCGQRFRQPPVFAPREMMAASRTSPKGIMASASSHRRCFKAADELAQLALSFQQMAARLEQPRHRPAIDRRRPTTHPAHCH
jgi:hypothetical protein